MINEDIITSLKNAIERGESLDSAISTAINSGYNRREVEEAAKFVGQGVINIEKIGNERFLTLPNKKRFFSKIFSPKPENTLKTATSLTPKIPKPNPQPVINTLPLPKKMQPELPNPIQYIQTRQLPESQTAEEIKQSLELPYQPQAINPSPKILRPVSKQSYTKEIILLIILLILIGILIITFRFRDQIMNFFSG